MSTHNILFHGEIKKKICGYPSYLELCKGKETIRFLLVLVQLYPSSTSFPVSAVVTVVREHGSEDTVPDITDIKGRVSTTVITLNIERHQQIV